METLKNAAQSLQEKVKMKMAKSNLEKALLEATTNENWTTDTKVLAEIAEYSYDYGDGNYILKFIWERINYSNKKWRIVLKGLHLVEYLLMHGSQRLISDFRDDLFKIQRLQDYQAFESGSDKGLSSTQNVDLLNINSLVRDKSKQITELLTSESKLEQEREKAKKIKENLAMKLGSASNTGGIRQSDLGSYGGYGNTTNKPGNSSGSGNIARKYEGYGGDNRYYDSSKYGGQSSTNYEFYTGHYDRQQDRKRDDLSKEDDVKLYQNTINIQEYVVRSGTKYDKKESKQEPPKQKEEKQTEQIKKIPIPQEFKEFASYAQPKPAEQSKQQQTQQPQQISNLLDIDEKAEKNEEDIWKMAPPPTTTTQVAQQSVGQSECQIYLFVEKEYLGKWQESQVSQPQPQHQQQQSQQKQSLPQQQQQQQQFQQFQQAPMINYQQMQQQQQKNSNQAKQTPIQNTTPNLNLMYQKEEQTPSQVPQVSDKPNEQKKELKNYSDLEASLINLSDLGTKAGQKDNIANATTFQPSYSQMRMPPQQFNQPPMNMHSMQMAGGNLPMNMNMQQPMAQPMRFMNQPMMGPGLYPQQQQQQQFYQNMPYQQQQMGMGGFNYNQGFQK